MIPCVQAKPKVKGRAGNRTRDLRKCVSKSHVITPSPLNLLHERRQILNSQPILLNTFTILNNPRSILPPLRSPLNLLPSAFPPLSLSIFLPRPRDLPHRVTPHPPQPPRLARALAKPPKFSPQHAPATPPTSPPHTSPAPPLPRPTRNPPHTPTQWRKKRKRRRRRK